jgi:SAM-dependent methyltransferase
MLELGPGDTLFSAMIARSLGAEASYLVDTQNYSENEIHPYKVMAKYLSEKEFAVPDMDLFDSVEELLKACSANYRTEGLQSLQEIPNKSVDFLWSQAVLEHVRSGQFLEFIRESRRILRDDGVCSHRIDLQDHLGGALNNLRLSDRIWESSLMVNSGFYTNRIRYSEMVNCFKQANFDVEVWNVERWESLPTKKSKLAARFRNLSDEELCVSGFDVILRPI